MSSLIRSITFLIILVVAPMILAPPCAAVKDEAFISVNAAELTDWWQEDWEGIRPAGEIYYNRVDGFVLYVGVGYKSFEHLHPRLRALVAKPTARKDPLLKIEVEQPVGSQNGFSFGASAYDKTEWSREDGENITDTENTLLALFWRQEFRDYYQRRGFSVFVQQRVGPEFTARLEYRNDACTPLTTKQHVWSSFRRKHDWRENPPLTFFVDETYLGEFEGRLKGYYGSVVYDSRAALDDPGWSGSLFLEYYGRAVGGSTDFRKYLTDVRGYFKLSETMRLNARASWGLASGDVPSFKLFYLGGLGTLRGYDYREFTGKRLFFASAEYMVAVTNDFDLVFFGDVGQVSWGSSTVGSGDENKADFGLGIQSADEDIRLDIARPATTEEADIRITVRLGYRF